MDPSATEVRIDAHQHFWKYDAEKHSWINDEMTMLQRDFLPPDLQRHLDDCDMDGCIVVQAEQSEEETQFLLALQEQYSFIKGVVGWLDLCADDLPRKLERYCRNPAFKGLRHIVQDEPDKEFMLRPDFLRGIGWLKEYDLTYDILIYSHQLPVAVEFADRFPDQPFVLDHMAKPPVDQGKLSRWEQGLRLLAQHPNMYCKVSGLVTEADWKNWQKDDFKPYLDVVFDAFGPERLMAGSDWPVCTLAAGYDEVLEIVSEYTAHMPPDQQGAIFGSTAARFYNL